MKTKDLEEKLLQNYLNCDDFEYFMKSCCDDGIVYETALDWWHEETAKHEDRFNQ